MLDHCGKAKVHMNNANNMAKSVQPPDKRAMSGMVFMWKDQFLSMLQYHAMIWAVFKTSVPIQNRPLGSFGALWVPEGLLSLHHFGGLGERLSFHVSPVTVGLRAYHTRMRARNSQHSALILFWQTPALVPTENAAQYTF